MELRSYGRKLYQFYGKIYLLLMIGFRDEQGFKSRFENKYKATINQNKEDYLQLKNDFGNISQELSKDEDHLLSGIAQLFDNLDNDFFPNFSFRVLNFLITFLGFKCFSKTPTN